LVIPNTWTLTWSVMMFPIKLVFQMSDFRYEIKTSLPVIWLETIDFEKIRVGPYATNTHNWSWFGWSGRWWRLKRSSTNWSFFSKWYGTGLGSSSSKLLCRDSLRSAPLFSVSARSTIDRDSLVRVRISYPVSYRVSYLIEPRISTCIYSTRT
jgi:hypothetical protein